MKPIIIANWKMKLGHKESIDLANKLQNGLIKEYGNLYDRIVAIKNRWAENLDLVLCPSFISVNAVHKRIIGSGIKLGAQDVFWEEKGAYTGEIAVSMLKEVKVEYVIVGHSERRRYLNETDEMIHKKLKLLAEEKITPILCIGETFDERTANQKDYVIVRQLIKALEGIKFLDDQKLIIAYEPIWVIGTGQAVEPEEANLSAKMIKTALLDIFSQKFIDNNIKVIYGGSVSSKDAKDFLSQENIDGALIGTASWNAEEFLRIINQCK
ncbi:triose-phosphate isomerase [Patescibacteria group bacterium]